MIVVFEILSFVLAVLLVLSIRKNMKIYDKLAKCEDEISKLKENQEKLKSALELSIQALQSDEAEKLNLRLQNAKLLKDRG
ncbi:hypothetical protein OFO01_03640 [Campylobacter sp. JMF_01 NE2]|uniref:hypothetical protein n=1 Tax=unclassified Campylobacter TaxID=2593542 RepID=UPI0022E9A654|nr:MULTISPECIES: hypothetical protein [unclassified Campylobacter]MDA3043580.1 hypothetical protein [Campylobacter sp. JMF_09 ED2]MDA3044127.1 hypothetical protein [Campylobacter sp. JMF_07 ED4]MDA3049279.1 hypothetical protein [Campylobacter sp. JMF_15 NE4]MDA3051296.1 hypothetical protein [Campylobacter sp. JMF_02 ED1]MDA3052538.1 hypothetical protein [Campylobacter sp. JMF_03 NE3]